MTTQGLVYSHNNISKIEVENATADPQCSFDSIPNELIEYHIFGYFWFHYWTQHFVSVCKRWKQICENSTITPKHLRISLKRNMDTEQVELWVKKYQPTILELNFNNIQPSWCAIHQLVGASECIDTLLINNAVSLALLNPSPPLSGIRTLVLNATSSNGFEIFKLFPALQRLQTDSFGISAKQNIPFKDLTVIEADVDYFLKHANVPKLTLVSENKVVKKINGKVTELLMPDLTYEEYFRYFGRTKLFVMLSRLNFPAATKLLEQSTSFDYEANLIENNIFSYKYPTTNRITNFDDIFTNDYGEYYKQHPNLVCWRKLPISDNFKFIRLTYDGEVHSAVAILAKLGGKIITDIDGRTSVSIQRAFFELLSHAQIDKGIFDDSKVRESAKVLLVTATKFQDKRGYDLISTAQQFEKIEDLIDWSKIDANINDYDLFWAMIAKGAKMPYRTFADHALHAQATSPFSKILYEVTKRNPFLWHEILRNVSSQTLSKIRSDEGVATGEKIKVFGLTNGDATARKTVKIRSRRVNLDQPKPSRDDLIKLYINHMDSAGSTFLLKMIEDLDEQSIERLLMGLQGVDPNVHQQGRLSPLATLLVRSASKQQLNSKMIHLLVKAGADVNLVCMFEGRMCLPLMIAVLVGSSLPTISLLIALGARTDYCDDQGRSVEDCVVESESKYDASDYRTLKWLVQ